MECVCDCFSQWHRTCTRGVTMFGQHCLHCMYLWIAVTQQDAAAMQGSTHHRFGHPRLAITHHGAQARASCWSTVSSSTGALGLYFTTYFTYSKLSSRPSRPDAISSTRPKYPKSEAKVAAAAAAKAYCVVVSS